MRPRPALTGTISPNGPDTVTYGFEPTFAFTPTTGYHIDSVFVDNVSIAVAPTDTIKNVTANHAIRVTFAINTYTITASAGAHGSIAPAGVQTVPYGGSQAYAFTPAVGYHVDSLFVDSVLVAAVPADTFTNVMSNHTIRVTFAINTFTITASADSNGGISPMGAVVVDYGSDQEFTFSPNTKYVLDSLFIDGVGLPSPATYTFNNVTANHTIHVTYKLAPVYTEMFRTFTYDSLAAQFAKTANKKKNIDDYFEIPIVNTSATTQTLIVAIFKNAVTQVVSSGSMWMVGAKTSWTLTGSLAPGDTVIVKGRSKATKAQSIAKLYFGAATKGNLVATNVAASLNRLELPMPNTAAVRDNAFALGAFGGSKDGMIIGDSLPALKKSVGWVQIASGKAMYSSMLDATGMHTSIPDGYNFVGGLKSLAPKKQNNLPFAEIMTLKFNIGISEIGITAPGFGQLVFSMPGSPFNNMPLDTIAERGDSMMTWRQYFANRAFWYDSLVADLRLVNAAFSGPIDTVSWGSGLSLKGTQQLGSVSFLVSSGAKPVTIKPKLDLNAVDELPVKAKLEQNYPNPFNPTTTIQFELPKQSVVTMRIYNILGQLVTTLLDKSTMDAGTQQAEFNGANYASGVYFCRVEIDEIQMRLERRPARGPC